MRRRGSLGLALLLCGSWLGTVTALAVSSLTVTPRSGDQQQLFTAVYQYESAKGQACSGETITFTWDGADWLSGTLGKDCKATAQGQPLAPGHNAAGKHEACASDTTMPKQINGPQKACQPITVTAAPAPSPSPQPAPSPTPTTVPLPPSGPPPPVGGPAQPIPGVEAVPLGKPVGPLPTPPPGCADLGRDPTPTELEAGVAQLRSGGADERIRADIVGSPEYLALAGNTNDGFIARVYRDLLHRDVDPGGLISATALVGEGSPGRQQVAGAVLGSSEYRALGVQSAFAQLLGRRPSAEELNLYDPGPGPGASSDRLKASLMSSQEYFARSGGTATSWLDHAYRDLLGRARGAASSAPLLAAYGGGGPVSRSLVINSLLGSPEYLALSVTADYHDLLRPASCFGVGQPRAQSCPATQRQPSPAELASGLAALDGADTRRLVANIVGSQEYLALADLDGDGLRALYRDLLGRVPTSAELAAATAAGAPGRPQVVIGILGSSEYRTRLVRSFYTRLLGREPTAGELAASIGTVASGSTDRVVIGILGSPEFIIVHGGTNDGWLDGAYSILFGQPPDAATSATLHRQQTSDGSTVQWPTRMIGSPEYHAAVVTGTYLEYLGHRRDCPAAVYSSSPLDFVARLPGGWLGPTAAALAALLLLVVVSVFVRSRFGSDPVDAQRTEGQPRGSLNDTRAD